MPSCKRYETLEFGRPTGHRVITVPLAGVPQIPDEARDYITRLGEYAMPPRLERLCDESIREAMLELTRRRLAKLAGLRMSDYFPALPVGDRS